MTDRLQDQTKVGLADNRLDMLLMDNRAPDAPGDLATIIIARAAGMRQEARSAYPNRPAAGWSVRQWIGEVLQAFAIPKPALSLGAVLVVGLLIGLDFGTVASLSDDAGIGDWSTMLSSGEGWL